MARQSSVDAAYSSLNHNKKRGGWARLCASLAIAAFVIFFLSAGDNSKADTDNLRSGQAHHIVDSVGVPPISSSGGYDSERDAAAEILVDQELQEAVDEATDDIKEAETQELKKEDAMLEAEVSTLGNSMRLRMGGMFSKFFTFDEMSTVATQVEQALTTEVENELRDQADKFADTDVTNMEVMIDAAEEAGTDPDKIEDDLYNQQAFAVQELRADIDQAADHLREHMKIRAAEIEKEILELRLSAKMGKKIKLVIVDDEVQVLDNSPNSAYAPQSQTQGYYGQPQQSAVSSTYGYAPVQTGYGVSPDPAQPAYNYGAATPAQPDFDTNEDRDYEDGDGNEENETEQNEDRAEPNDGNEKKSGGGKLGGWW